MINNTNSYSTANGATPPKSQEPALPDCSAPKNIQALFRSNSPARAGFVSPYTWAYSKYTITRANSEFLRGATTNKSASPGRQAAPRTETYKHT